ncbi:DUF536 domain-containing protein, partial [Lactiplantibacillus plantarum]|uniref:DUF536 domain-containing protein n=4 Tax=Lactiplantibacillus plantarum TaxID=1590 RepID=UPI0021820B4A
RLGVVIGMPRFVFPQIIPEFLVFRQSLISITKISWYGLTVNNFLQAQTKEQSAFIELLKQQLEVKDEQIATTNRIADQAQQLDLTTHKQSQPSLPRA